MSKEVTKKTLEGSIWNNFVLSNLTHLTNVILKLLETKAEPRN